MALIADWKLNETSPGDTVIDATGAHQPATLPGRSLPGSLPTSPALFAAGETSRLFGGTENTFAICPATTEDRDLFLAGGPLHVSLWAKLLEPKWQVLLELAPNADEDGTAATNALFQLGIREDNLVDIGSQADANEWTDLISNDEVPVGTPFKLDVVIQPSNAAARSPVGQASFVADDGTISGFQRVINWPGPANGSLAFDWYIQPINSAAGGGALYAADKFAVYIDGVSRGSFNAIGPGTFGVSGAALSPGPHLVQIFWFRSAPHAGDETWVRVDNIVARDAVAGAIFENWTFTNGIAGWDPLAQSFVDGWISDPDGNLGTFQAVALAQQVQLYINGALSRTWTGQPLPTYTGALQNLYWTIGTDRGPAVDTELYAGYLHGSLDDIQIENVAPNGSEILSNYTADNSGGAIPGSVTMGVYYTNMLGLGVTNIATTFTHGLSITPALLVARPVIHQPLVTCTAPLQVCTIGTNIITIASGVGTLVTCDLEVQRVHSLVGGDL